MTAINEFYKLFRKLNQQLEREIFQNLLDSYDEETKYTAGRSPRSPRMKNPAIRPIKESTFKVRRPFKVERL